MKRPLADGGVGVADAFDRQLVECDLDVDEAHDIEEPPDVRGGIGDDQNVGFTMRDETTAGRHERAQQ